MPIYLTPGPSHRYPKLREYLDDAWDADVISWSHRSTQFTELYNRAEQAILELMAVPPGYRVLFVGSATEAMERVIQGLVNQKSHHIILGAFGEKWQQIANQLGKQTSASHLQSTDGIQENILSVPDSTELICVTLNETSIGVMMPEHILRQLDTRPKHQLIAFDIVSAAPLIDMDWRHIDVAFFSVQKAFGLPAGLGVIIVSEKALERAESMTKAGLMTGSYHSLSSLARAADKSQTPETPNVLNIYLLTRVAEDMLTSGIHTIRDHTKQRANQLYAALENSRLFNPYVANALWRSLTIIVAETKASNQDFVKHLHQHGLIAGKGYAPEHKERHIRIANFPAISDETFDELSSYFQSWPK